MLWHRGDLVTLPRRFPSSQVCQDCGAQGGEMPSDVRRCDRRSCGMIYDRDVNAALNIRDFRPGAPGRLTVEASGSCLQAHGKAGAASALASEAVTHLPDPDYVDNRR